MSIHRPAAILPPLLSVLVLVLPGASAAGAAPEEPATLVDIRAAHHPGVDRIVFEFQGGLPELGALRWTSTPPTYDPSGLPSHTQGDAFVTVTFLGAAGHAPSAPFASTYGPERRAYDLPNIAHVVTVGDWEAVLEVAIGVMVRTDTLRATALHAPPRWVIDIGTGFPKRTLDVWYLDRDRIDGPPPYVVPVSRVVPRATSAHALLHRLWAGPTQAERAAGLRFVASEADGFAGLRINDAGVARVRLTGGCDGMGSTIATIATELQPTLRQLGRVDWVKILDPSGATGRPTGPSDSIPACLEP